MHKATATNHKGACVLNCAGGFVNSADPATFGQCLASAPPVTGADVILNCAALPKPLPAGKKCACATGMTYNANINRCVGMERHRRSQLPRQSIVERRRLRAGRERTDARVAS